MHRDVALILIVTVTMKITVVTAVCDSEATVEEAIASIARQTYPDVEHIVIDGNSKDGSLAAIKRAAHHRMVLFSEPDTGIYDALNKGIGRATGDVIGFVHSDDFLAHEKVLERICTVFSDPEVEAVFSDLDYVSQANASRVIRSWATGHFSPGRLRRGWMPAHPTLYLRRGVYTRCGVFDTRFGISADYDFILRYFSQAPGKSVYIPEVLYKMRLGGVSNRNKHTIFQKMKEDYWAIRRHRVGGIMTLIGKNVSKIKQFAV